MFSSFLCRALPLSINLHAGRRTTRSFEYKSNRKEKFFFFYIAEYFILLLLFARFISRQRNVLTGFRFAGERKYFFYFVNADGHKNAAQPKKKRRKGKEKMEKRKFLCLRS